MKFNKKNNKIGGFTIIETMISLALFIVIITAGMTALLNANLLHQKSQDMRSIMDNLNFIMDDISRSLRTGTNYHCYVYALASDSGNEDSLFPTPLSALAVAKSCDRGDAISFETASGDPDDLNDQVFYYIYNNTSLNTSIMGKINGTYSPLAPQITTMTPPEVFIDPVASGFSVLGGSAAQQPFVTIRLVGKITSQGVVTPFSLQTSVSQRALN